MQAGTRKTHYRNVSIAYPSIRGRGNFTKDGTYVRLYGLEEGTYSKNLIKYIFFVQCKVDSFVNMNDVSKSFDSPLIINIKG